MVPRARGSHRAIDHALLTETVALAFSQRRKTLRNTLARALTAADFEALQIDPQARAQTLSVDQFVKIADYRAQQQARAHARA